MQHIEITSDEILNNPEYFGLTTADLNVSPEAMATAVACLEELLGFDEPTPAAWRQAARDDLAEDAQFFVAVTSGLDELAMWLDAEDVGAFYLTKVTGSEEWKDKAAHTALIGVRPPMLHVLRA